MSADVTTATDARDKAFEILRQPFPPENIAKLPKVNCNACTQAARAERGATCDEHRRTKCDTCGNYITTGHIHLDYVGHAEATDRLLDADPEWTWEPMALTPDGLPLFDGLNGMWIRLTVAGVTRIGYGSANGKQGPDAIKEVIGDAIRNSGMRFGLALDLWAKTNIHTEGADQHPDTDWEWVNQLHSLVEAASSPDVLDALKVAVRAKIDAGAVGADAQRQLQDHFAHRRRTLAGTQQPAHPVDEWTTPAPGTPDNPGITRPQMTMLHATFGEKGITDRADKLAFASRVIGRPLESSEDLSKAEAHKVINALNTGELPALAGPVDDNMAEALSAAIARAETSDKLADVTEAAWKAKEGGRISEQQHGALIDQSMAREAELSAAVRQAREAVPA